MKNSSENNFGDQIERALQNRRVFYEAPGPEKWTGELAKKWVSSIPENLEANSPETPTLELDLSSENLGKVLVKDESRLEINPTGTMKDRVARVCANIYRENAKYYLYMLENEPGFKKSVPGTFIPRRSLLTSGNAGLAVARALNEFRLPSPKLLLDIHTDEKILNKLKLNNASIYLVDLKTNPFSGQPSFQAPLTSPEIKILTNNEFGDDLTSAGGANMFVDVPAIFYKKMARDTFKQEPDEVYMPYGGGTLHADFATMQFLFGKGMEPELGEKLAKQVRFVKLFGAEPKDLNSIADKLTAPAKPFAVTFAENLEGYRRQGFTPPESGIGKVSEEEIKEAWELMKKYGKPQGMKTEPSGAAGMALYIKRKRAGLIKNNAKILIINSGCGIVSEKAA